MKLWTHSHTLCVARLYRMYSDFHCLRNDKLRGGAEKKTYSKKVERKTDAWRPQTASSAWLYTENSAYLLASFLVGMETQYKMYLPTFTKSEKESYWSIESLLKTAFHWQLKLIMFLLLYASVMLAKYLMATFNETMMGIYNSFCGLTAFKTATTAGQACQAQKWLSLFWFYKCWAEIYGGSSWAAQQHMLWTPRVVPYFGFNF